MRKNKAKMIDAEFKIMTLDDDAIMTDTIKSYFEKLGYFVDTENDPLTAIDRIRNNDYDILLLDFLMRPICGDEVVRQIRKFNRDIFIVLLTGHKSMAPPVKTIRELDIQGYYEKSDRFDQLELLIESCVKSIRQLKTINKYKIGLQNMLKKLSELYICENIDNLISKILEFTVELFQCENAMLLVDLNQFQKDNLEINNEKFKYTGEINIQDEYSKMKNILSAFENSRSANIIQNDYIYIPIICQNNKISGVLAMNLEINADNEITQIFEVFVKQASAAIENACYQSMLNEKNLQIKKAYDELNANLIETINAMRLIVDTKDVYTRGHSDRVSYYSTLIAAKMRLSEKAIEKIRIAGLFHDIGKVGVPDTILLKKEKLTDAEFFEISKHPSYGRKILSAISHFGEVLDIIEDHHIYYNKKGYPDFGNRTELSIETRIISVADAFDAMTSKRSYREGLDVERAKKELIDCKNSQFDPVIVDAFIEVLVDYDKIVNELKWTFEEALNEEKAGAI